jgi:hypothetical protein
VSKSRRPRIHFPKASHDSGLEYGKTATRERVPGSGIGQCIAETFARAGAWVLVAELRAEAGDATVQRIREAGGAPKPWLST